MISGNELRPGVVIRLAGHVYVVESSVRAGTAQRRWTFHTRLRDVETGEGLQKAFQDDNSFEEVQLERREAQYCYKKGSQHFFLDQTDFEEHEFSDERLGNARHFIREGDTCKVLVIGGKALALELPPAVALEITETAPPIKGASDTVYKDARLETGLVVKVPPFLKQGERVRIATDTLEYLGKA